MRGLEIEKKNEDLLESSHRPHNCKTGHFMSWKDRERLRDAQE